MGLQWTDDLKVGFDVMDDDHRLLFDLLAQLPAVVGPQYLAVFDEVVHHLTQHFARENELMLQHGFFAYHCHHGEHQAVLEQVENLRTKAKAGDATPLQDFIENMIGPWFINHRNTMDWVTAQFLLSRV